LILSEKKKLVTCPICGQTMLQCQGHECVLKSRIVVFKTDQTIAKCKHCKNEVMVPIRLIG